MFRAPTAWWANKADYWGTFRRELNIAMDEAAEYTFGQPSTSAITLGGRK
jgi:hypothetical protein